MLEVKTKRNKKDKYTMTAPVVGHDKINKIRILIN